MPPKKNGNGGTTRQAKTDAEKVADFKATAGDRTNRVLRSIDALGKCTNPRKYSWTPEQSARILDAIQARLKSLEGAFQGAVSSTDFTL